MTRVAIPPLLDGAGQPVPSWCRIRLIGADAQQTLGFAAGALHTEHTRRAFGPDPLVLELVAQARLATPDATATWYEIEVDSEDRQLSQRWRFQVPDAADLVELRDLVGAAAIDPADIAAEILAPALEARAGAAADRQATAADRAQTAQDRAATAADSAQTALDRLATAADRVQTGADVAVCRAQGERAALAADTAGTAAASAQAHADYVDAAARQLVQALATGLFYVGETAETVSLQIGEALIAEDRATPYPHLVLTL